MANMKPTKGERLPPVNARTIKDNENTLKVLDLRKQGKSYDEIGREMGLDLRQVSHAISDAIKHWKEAKVASIDEVKNVSRIRLESLISKMWDAAMQGDPAAVAEIRKLDESIRKLYGVDAPTKIAPVMPNGDEPYSAKIDDAQRARDMASLLEAVGKEKA